MLILSEYEARCVAQQRRRWCQPLPLLRAVKLFALIVWRRWEPAHPGTRIGVRLAWEVARDTHRRPKWLDEPWVVTPMKGEG